MNTTSKILKLSPLCALLLLGACVTAPTGPSVLVLPGAGKSFDQFRADDNLCRQFASGQIGNTTAGENATDSGVRSAAIGTAIGAIAGAAIGGNSQGASVGAGAGLLMGSIEGSNAGQRSAYTTQQRYDNGYIQCMYSYGHRVPVSGHLMTEPAQSTRSVPPPPPGSPPPPPPSVR